MISKILLWLWQLPQNVIALIYYAICKIDGITEVFEFKGRKIIVKKSRDSVSLGDYLFISTYAFRNQCTTVIFHEYGHSVQSRYLGPLYFIVIGIPCLLHILVRALSKRARKKDYYSFFTEKWANILGGLE